jgi:SAM-dependent methyltransferase
MSFTEITETKDEPWKGAGSNKEYGESEYWDDRFAQEPSYEWLLTFKEVATQITPFFKSSDKILVVGCGNSDFSADLYDAGFTNVVNVDFSSIVIENMREKNQDRPEMEWKVRCYWRETLIVESSSVSV